MAILSKEEFFARLQERLANDTTDDGIRFLEDMTDTYNDWEQRIKGDGTDWEKKYRDNDATWARRYKDRFFSGTGGGMPNAVTKETDVETYNPDDVTIEDLFTEKEEN